MTQVEAAPAASEDALREALARKDVLYAELDHRTRNLMSMIGSFLSIMASRAESVETKAALRDAMQRIRALNVAHDSLMTLGAMDRVDLGAFLSQILRELMAIEGRRSVRLRCEVEPVETSVHQASNLGLVVSELAINALKHAFPQGGGEIRLEVSSPQPGAVRVVVADNGVGWDGTAPDGGGGLGLPLIEALARRARATVAITHDNGTRAVLDFPPLDAQVLAQQGAG